LRGQAPINAMRQTSVLAGKRRLDGLVLVLILHCIRSTMKIGVANLGAQQLGINSNELLVQEERLPLLGTAIRQRPWRSSW